jgi:hypothetical protein
LINGFVPTIGSTFKIVNFSSETGKFSTVNGLIINNKEHFTIKYQGTDVLLTVVSGALPTGQPINPRFFPGTVRPPSMFGRFQFGGIFDDLGFWAQNPGIASQESRPFQPGLWLTKGNFMAAPGRARLSTSFRTPSAASSLLRLSEAASRPANLSTTQFRVISAGSNAFRQVSSVSHSGLMPSAVNFAAVHGGGLGDNFRALSADGGLGAFASTVRTGANFRGSQFQSVSSGLDLAAIPAGSGLRGVNPSAPLPTRRGSGNFPTTRINSGSSALRGRAATPSFSVSVSNITSKPKLGFGID